MFIELNDGSLLNITWLHDVYINEEDTTQVTFEMTNQQNQYEQWNDESEAQSRVLEVRKMILG